MLNTHITSNPRFLLLSEKKIAALSKDELKNWTHLDEAEEDDEDGKNHTNT